MHPSITPSSVQRQVLQESKGDGTDFPGLLHFGLNGILGSFKFKIKHLNYFLVLASMKITIIYIYIYIYIFN